MKKSNVIFYLLLMCSGYLTSCGESTEEVKNSTNPADTFVQAEDDKLFAKYRDSLETYFGTIEIELIKQYKINHENLKDEEDFYLFYRNANTLRKGLNTSLNNFAKEKLAKGNETVHEMPWFSEVAKGMEIWVKNQGRSYSVQFDYADLDDHAEQTVGKADDEFMKLLHLSFYDHSDTPKWLHIIDLSKQNYCSELGSGKHLAALLQADMTTKVSDIFHKEVQKSKVQIISDAIFNHRYCYTQPQAIDELEQILEKVVLKDSEKKMLRNRIATIKKDSPELMFDCVNVDCPPAV